MGSSRLSKSLNKWKNWPNKLKKFRVASKKCTNNSTNNTGHYLSSDEIALLLTRNPTPICSIYGAQYAMCRKKRASRCMGLYEFKDGVLVCGYCAFGLNWKR